MTRMENLGLDLGANTQEQKSRLHSELLQQCVWVDERYANVGMIQVGTRLLATHLQLKGFVSMSCIYEFACQHCVALLGHHQVLRGYNNHSKLTADNSDLMLLYIKTTMHGTCKETYCGVCCTWSFFSIPCRMLYEKPRIVPVSGVVESASWWSASYGERLVVQVCAIPKLLCSNSTQV